MKRERTPTSTPTRHATRGSADRLSRTTQRAPSTLLHNSRAMSTPVGELLCMSLLCLCLLCKSRARTWRRNGPPADALYKEARRDHFDNSQTLQRQLLSSLPLLYSLNLEPSSTPAPLFIFSANFSPQHEHGPYVIYSSLQVCSLLTCCTSAFTFNTYFSSACACAVLCCVACSARARVRSLDSTRQLRSCSVSRELIGPQKQRAPLSRV